MPEYYSVIKRTIRETGMEIDPGQIYRDMERVIFGKVSVVCNASERSFMLPADEAALVRHLRQSTESLQKHDDIFVGLGTFARYLVQRTDKRTRFLMQLTGY